MDRGGAETMIMNLYRAMDRTEVQFDFLVHEERECDYDAEILSLGGRIFRAPRFNGVNYYAYRRVFRESCSRRILNGSSSMGISGARLRFT